MNKKHSSKKRAIIIGIALVLLLIIAMLVIFLLKGEPDAPADPTVGTQQTNGSESMPSTEDTGHLWQDATCTDPKTCIACGAVDGRPLGHQWDAGVVIKEAAEDTDGERKHTCTVCGATEIRIIPSKNHVHNYDQVVVTPPTCTEKGYTTHSCRCGDSYRDSEVVANGHSWEDAICTEPKTCTVCGATEGSAKDHNYNSVVTPPTETEQGYTTYICTICGDNYKSDYTNADGQTHEAGTLVFSTDGISRLYGENNMVVNTYSGWETAKYSYDRKAPWHANCADIIRVIIEDGVSPKNVHYWFEGCASLRSIEIPWSMVSASGYDFSECVNLTIVKFNGSLTQWLQMPFSASYSNPCTQGAQLYIDGKLLEELIIPDGTTHINQSAFYGCSSLKRVVIPDSITDIDEYAFGGCANLTCVTFGDRSRLTSIDNGTFAGCTNLQNMEIPDSVTSIGYWSFSGCTSLTKVDIHAGITHIWGSAFAGCTNLNELNVDPGNPTYYVKGNCIIEKESKTLVLGCKSSVIPKDGCVTSIGHQAFVDRYNLTSVEIPASVTYIGKQAFENCTNLSSIIFGDNSQLRQLDRWSFAGCTSLVNIEIPASVTGLGENAFQGCDRLMNVTFDEGIQLTDVGMMVFADCTSLTNIKIPAGMQYIGAWMFSGCESLTSITIPDNVTGMGYEAFVGCKNLTDIIFEGTVSQWLAVDRNTDWGDVPATEVICTDGTAPL